MSSVSTRKKVVSWAMYDWANSAFSTTVLAGFFPIFFKEYWSVGSDVTTATLRLGMANSLAGIFVAVLSPFLGAIADRGGEKRRFLILFSSLGVLATASLFLVSKGDWIMAALVFVLAGIGFNGSIVFNDSQLSDVCAEKDYHRVSALGYSLGYLGGGLLFAVNVAMTLNPKTFGLADAGEAIRYSFLSVAIWWALFSLPVFLFVKDSKDGVIKESYAEKCRHGWRELIGTLKAVRLQKQLLLFLAAYWIYIDGVGTVMRMAVDFGLSIGLETPDLISALLLTQFIGFPAALAFGYFGQKFGAKGPLLVAIGVYGLVSTSAWFIETGTHFMILAAVIGLVQGGVQSLSRSLYAQLIPQDRSAEYFGFYNMLGKFAAVLGPMVAGVAASVSGDPRMAVFSLIFFFIAGGLLLWRVEPPITVEMKPK